MVNNRARHTTYDADARAVSAKTSAGGTTYDVTQYGYDTLGRLECTARRMNPAAWGALPVSACAPGPGGAFGPDRIGRTTYDAVGQVTRVQSAYGTPDQADEAVASYTPNGSTATLTDGAGNRTS